jgi:formate hydrogenlyase subunit 3/multisubunit Na+/H+ antiporter MnhD subunit
MNIQTIVKIISAVFGLLGAIFLFRIIGAGDEEIKMAASMGDFGTVTPLVSLAIAILSITVIVTVLFSLLSLASSPEKLKKSLVFIGCFLLVTGIAYATSSGVETPMKDGEMLSASGSRWVETGLRMFYILATLAVLSMVFSGAKKILKR